MSSIARHETRFSYADYVLWEGGRFELVDGEVFDMSPAPSRAHQRALMALSR